MLYLSIDKNFDIIVFNLVFGGIFHCQSEYVCVETLPSLQQASKKQIE